MNAAARAAGARAAAWVSRRPRAAVGAVLLLLPAVLMWDAILGRGVLFQRDVHLYWHAEAEAFVRAIAAGSWPVWDATVGFGQPFLANSSAQVLYPITWLNLLVRPWWYYTFFVFAHLVFSAAGAYRAGRALACGRPAALTGALLWTASGPLVSLTILWHHFAGAAWLPWIFACAHGLATKRTARAALGLALALGGQQLAGSFDISAMGAFVASAVIVYGLHWPRPWASATDRALLARVAAAFALAFGMSAGQWMATAEVASYSGRRSLSREVRTYWSVHPVALADLVLPGFTADAPVSDAVRKELFEGRDPFMASLYLGLPSACLVLGAFFHRARRRVTWFLAALATLALLLSLGRHFPFYDLVVAAAPPLKAFRYPVKVMVLVALPWSLLAAIGTDVWRRDPGADPAAARLIRAMTAGLVAAALAAAGGLLLARSTGARNVVLVAGLTAISVAAAGWRLRAGGGRPATVAAVIAVVDLVLFHRSMNKVGPVELYTHRPEVLRYIAGSPWPRVYAYDYSVAPTADTPKPATATHALARTPAGWDLEPSAALAQQMALTPVAASRWGLRGSFEVDYTGLFPVHVNQAAYYLRSLERTDSHLRFLQIGGVTHVVARHEEPFADLRPVATVPGLYESPIRVFAVPDPMPHSFVASRSRSGEGISGLVVLADHEFDFRSEVLIPPGAPPATAGRPGRSRIVSASADRMKLEVDAPDGGYLVVLESYDPGWRATVDGQPTPIVPGNVLFRAIRLAPGARDVDLVYRPPGLVAGLVVSALSILAALALAWRTTHARVVPDTGHA